MSAHRHDWYTAHVVAGGRWRAQVAELAKELGLKPHKVKDGEGKEVELFSPVETKGILGSDDRYAAHPVCMFVCTYVLWVSL